MKKILLVSVIFTLLSLNIFSQTNPYSKPRKYNDYIQPFDHKRIENNLRGYDTKINNQRCLKMATYIMENFQYDLVTHCNGSTFIDDAYFYDLNGRGIVIAFFIRKNSSIPQAYVYCGISEATFREFAYYGKNDSWGKSFHFYIIDNKCNC